MTVTATGMATAIQDLRQALDTPCRPGAPLGSWRWLIRQRMAAVRDALVAETHDGDDGWLTARGGRVLRERNALLARLSALSPGVLESPEVDSVRGQLQRLVVDVSHHVQRLHDLAYDEVELELGGSE